MPRNGILTSIFPCLFNHEFHLGFTYLILKTHAAVIHTDILMSVHHATLKYSLVSKFRPRVLADELASLQDLLVSQILL